MYVPVFWKHTINYEENENGHGWFSEKVDGMQLGGSLGYGWFAVLEELQTNVGYAILKKIVVRGRGYAFNRNGNNVTLQKWGVLILSEGWDILLWKIWIEGYAT